jgi:RNA-binding protein
MISPKNRALLRKLANHLTPSLNLGKGELDESVIASTNNALKAHELIKVKVLNNSNISIEEISKNLSSATKSDVVGIIGHIIILYRPNQDHPIINLE